MSRVRAVLVEELVRCDECGARPFVRCTTVSGVVCKYPHAKRVARKNGLKQTPRRGHFVRPKEGIQYDEDEIAAIAQGR